MKSARSMRRRKRKLANAASTGAKTRLMYLLITRHVTEIDIAR